MQQTAVQLHKLLQQQVAAAAGMHHHTMQTPLHQLPTGATLSNRLVTAPTDTGSILGGVMQEQSLHFAASTATAAAAGC